MTTVIAVERNRGIGLPLATQAQARAGTSNAALMTPARTTDQIRQDRVNNGSPVPQDVSSTTATDIRTGINTLMAAGVKSIFIPPGTYPFLGALNALPTGTSIYAWPGTVTFTLGAGSYDAFTINDDYCSISGISLNGNLKTGGADFRVSCGSSGSVIETNIDDVISTNSQAFLADSGTGTGIHYRTYLRRCKVSAPRADALPLTRAWAFIYLDCVVDFVPSSSPNHTGISITATGLPAASGGYYLNTNIAGTAGTSAQKGIVCTDANEIHLQPDFRCDTLGGEAIYLNGCNNGFLFGSIGLCNGIAVHLSNANYFDASWMRIRGRNTAGGTAAIDGVYLEGSSLDNTLDGLVIFEVTGYGINDNATATNFVSRHNHIYDCTLRAVKTTGAGDRTFQNHRWKNNTAGNYDLTSTSDLINDCRLSSGLLSGSLNGAAVG